MAEALKFIEKAESQSADFIEVRLDYLEKPNQLADIANYSNTPLIATNRSIKCQGKFSGNESERKKILLDAAEKDFDYIDVELSTPKLKNVINDLREIGVKPIVSFHDFNGTPSLSQLKKILKRETEAEADVCKIVTTAKRVQDNLTALDFVSKACKTATVICFCMGELGKPSRLLSPLFGGFFTMAALERGRETASGQLTIQEMQIAYQALGLL